LIIRITARQMLQKVEPRTVPQIRTSKMIKKMLLKLKTRKCIEIYTVLNDLTLDYNKALSFNNRLGHKPFKELTLRNLYSIRVFFPLCQYTS
jgi:hypothetical protein